MIGWCEFCAPLYSSACEPDPAEINTSIFYYVHDVSKTGSIFSFLGLCYLSTDFDKCWDLKWKLLVTDCIYIQFSDHTYRVNKKYFRTREHSRFLRETVGGM